jgi:hypothetical protein
MTTMQRLKININNPNHVDVLININQQLGLLSQEFFIDLDVDNIIELQQAVSDKHDFFYIHSVEFGKLNITELLHHGICQVVDFNGNKLADFVKDIGKTDRVIITVNQDFYSLVIKHIDLISLL